jgi:hypothetical protein
MTTTTISEATKVKFAAAISQLMQQEELMKARAQDSFAKNNAYLTGRLVAIWHTQQSAIRWLATFRDGYHDEGQATLDAAIVSALMLSNDKAAKGQTTLTTAAGIHIALETINRYGIA